MNVRLTTLVTFLFAVTVAACSGTDAPEDFIYDPPKYEPPKSDTPTPAPTASTDSAPITPPDPPAPKPEVAPGISALDPPALTLGAIPDTGADIKITGHDFKTGATVKLGTASLSAKADSDTQMTVHVGTERLRDAGDQPLVVVNPSGMASNELTFTVATPSSVAISKISPSSVNAFGNSAVTITITGAGFIQGSVARFNGASVETAFKSATSITAIVPASMVQTAGKYSLTVSNSSAVVSLPASLDVLNPAPAISAISPATIHQAAASITMEIQGSNFTPATSVYANGAPQSNAYVTYVSSNRIQFLVNAASAIGTYKIQVATPSPGGGASGAANFTITY